MHTSPLPHRDWMLPHDPMLQPGTRVCWLAIAGSIAGFAALVSMLRWMPGGVGAWLGVILFVAIQLAAATPAIRAGWRAMFRRPTWRDVLIAVACVPLAVILPAIMAYVVVGSAHLSDNSTIGAAGSLPPLQLVNLFASSGLQLFGEELVAILPFLAILAMLHRLGMKPWVAMVLAWLISSLAFGALHLPTYHWHWGQALLAIGMARVVLTAVFLLTRSIWASTVAHVVNDWSMLALSVLAAHTVQ